MGLTNSGTQLWETQTAYDSEGHVTQTIAADGQTTNYEFDSLGRKTAEIGTPVSLGEAGLTGLSDDTGVTVRLRTETVYDTLGWVWIQKQNVWEIVYPNGTVEFNRSAEEDITYTYDEFDHVIQTTYTAPGCPTTSTSSAYDALGRKTSDTNQLGQTTSYTYDGDDRLTSVTLPAVWNPATGQIQQPVYTYGYDAFGNQTFIQDPLGRQTFFTYDDEGHEQTRTLPLGQGTSGDWTETFKYDDRGRQTLHISFEGVVTKYIYNSQGRLGRRISMIAWPITTTARERPMRPGRLLTMPLGGRSR